MGSKTKSWEGETKLNERWETIFEYVQSITLTFLCVSLSLFVIFLLIMIVIKLW